MRRTYTEPAREIPVIGETDVLVAGSGPAGFSAAVCAAPEQLKTLCLEMLEEAGVTLLLYTAAVDVIMEGDLLRGVIIENKEGRQAVYARVIIDATGDGDIAARAGVPYTLGREEDGRMQPATIMFKVGGVDTERAAFPGCICACHIIDKFSL